MPPSSLRETDRVSHQKPQRISGPKPGDYELGSLESRAAARAMYDAQPIEESCKVLLIFKSSTFTTANFINPRGDIVGAYVDAAGVSHGFVLSGELIQRLTTRARLVPLSVALTLR